MEYHEEGIDPARPTIGRFIIFQFGFLLYNLK